jgi:hypothetical protein
LFLTLLLFFNNLSATSLPCHSTTWWSVPQLCSFLTLLIIPLEICFPTFPLIFPSSWLLFPLLSEVEGNCEIVELKDK